MKKIICILLVIIVILLTFISLKLNKDEKLPAISFEDAQKEVKKALKLDNIEEDRENKPLILSSNKYRTIVVKEDSYIYIDHTHKPARLYQFKTRPKLVEVTILDIKEDGYRVRHGDHEDFIGGKPPADSKVGDKVEVPDPHTRLSHIDEDFSGRVEDHDHDHDHENDREDKSFFQDIIDGLSDYFSELRDLLKN